MFIAEYFKYLIHKIACEEPCWERARLAAVVWGGRFRGFSLLLTGKNANVWWPVTGLALWLSKVYFVISLPASVALRFDYCNCLNWHCDWYHMFSENAISAQRRFKGTHLHILSTFYLHRFRQSGPESASFLGRAQKWRLIFFDASPMYCKVISGWNGSSHWSWGYLPQKRHKVGKVVVVWLGVSSFVFWPRPSTR